MHDLTLRKKTGQPMIKYGLGGRYETTMFSYHGNQKKLTACFFLDLLPMVILLPFLVVQVSWVVMLLTSLVNYQSAFKHFHNIHSFINSLKNSQARYTSRCSIPWSRWSQTFKGDWWFGSNCSFRIWFKK